MTNQEKLATITPEKCYEKMLWLITVYGKRFTQSNIGIIEWLQKEAIEEDYKDKPVIFCKDCKYRDEKGYCSIINAIPHDSFTCILAIKNDKKENKHEP